MAASETKRFVVELFGSFFLTVTYLQTQKTTIHHEITVAAAYASLLFSLSPQISLMGAQFNLITSTAVFIVGKRGLINSIVAVIAQLIGTVIGVAIVRAINNIPVTTDTIHLLDASSMAHNNFNDNETGDFIFKVLLMDFLFAILLSAVSTSIPREGNLIFPIAMGSCLIAGSTTCLGVGYSNAALNPLIDFLNSDAKTFLTHLYRMVSVMLGAIMGGLMTRAILESEQAVGSMSTSTSTSGLGSLQDVDDSTEQQVLSTVPPSHETPPGQIDQRCGWCTYPIRCMKGFLAHGTGFLVEGIGAFYIMLVYSCTKKSNTSASLFPIAMGSLLLCLNYSSRGGYFSPAATLAVYLQDRNTNFPVLSTTALLLYVSSQILFSFLGAILSVWLLNFDIGYPKITTSNIGVLVLETTLTALVLTAFVFSSPLSARIWTSARRAVHPWEQQCIAVGLAQCAGTMSVSAATGSALNPATALAAVIVEFSLQHLYSDRLRNNAAPANLPGLWLLILGPCVAAVIVGFAFAIALNVNSRQLHTYIRLPTNSSSRSAVRPSIFEETSVGRSAWPQRSGVSNSGGSNDIHGLAARTDRTAEAAAAAGSTPSSRDGRGGGGVRLLGPLGSSVRHQENYSTLSIH